MMRKYKKQLKRNKKLIYMFRGKETIYPKRDIRIWFSPNSCVFKILPKIWEFDKTGWKTL